MFVVVFARVCFRTVCLHGNVSKRCFSYGRFGGLLSKERLLLGRSVHSWAALGSRFGRSWVLLGCSWGSLGELWLLGWLAPGARKRLPREDPEHPKAREPETRVYAHTR